VKIDVGFAFTEGDLVPVLEVSDYTRHSVLADKEETFNLPVVWWPQVHHLKNLLSVVLAVLVFAQRENPVKDIEHVGVPI
jgi:hypothetical protein